MMTTIAVIKYAGDGEVGDVEPEPFIRSSLDDAKPVMTDAVEQIATQIVEQKNLDMFHYWRPLVRLIRGLLTAIAHEESSQRERALRIKCENLAYAEMLVWCPGIGEKVKKVLWQCIQPSFLSLNFKDETLFVNDAGPRTAKPESSYIPRTVQPGSSYIDSIARKMLAKKGLDVYVYGPPLTRLIRSLLASADTLQNFAHTCEGNSYNDIANVCPEDGKT